MPFEFKLPDLGEGITEAELRRWLVKEGDRVAEHQGIAEVETDKAVVEIPSPRAGQVVHLLRKEGELVPVGAVLLTIALDGEEATPRPRSVGIVGELPEAEEVRIEPKVGKDVLATPAVRALAREMGVDLEGITGSGPRGSITREDLLTSTGTATSPPDLFGEVERVPLRGVRRTIARNLLLSQRQTAFVTGMEEADVTELWQLRVRERGEMHERGIHLTFFPFIIKAVQHALQEHPYLNASIDDTAGEIILKKYCNVGIAVDTTDGLMVPVLRDVAHKSPLELAEELDRLGERARARTITLEEMRGSSFTITNYGHFGGTYATPIINYPDVAILGCGRIAERPWVVSGAILIRRILHLSLTFDHRVTDGVDAARFLRKVVKYLEDPALLFIESV
ncbi:dihydrolipoamide acetyltransferase family protein [Geomobilimonas luticola]|uniref:Dihydrolipoamide acetyltransferase component of pyruvate dehydrogenase complex n=1 Tax=Geomobilimonas luticola TaxID=1114878 RepID=A0ABS5SF91_9BACT|nr:dihydrolipoamide acetyltransferase family protein [Geomobilimonas luticola]MBT0652692.1 2-oxo acid dehydrogenase subunit E2 [Geomobilimonas luticola]